MQLPPWLAGGRRSYTATLAGRTRYDRTDRRLAGVDPQPCRRPRGRWLPGHFGQDAVGERIGWAGAVTVGADQHVDQHVRPVRDHVMAVAGQPVTLEGRADAVGS